MYIIKLKNDKLNIKKECNLLLPLDYVLSYSCFGV